MNCVVSKLPLTQVLLFRGLDARNVETARLYGNVNKRLAFWQCCFAFSSLPPTSCWTLRMH